MFGSVLPSMHFRGILFISAMILGLQVTLCYSQNTIYLLQTPAVAAAWNGDCSSSSCTESYPCTIGSSANITLFGPTSRVSCNLVVLPSSESPQLEFIGGPEVDSISIDYQIDCDLRHVVFTIASSLSITSSNRCTFTGELYVRYNQSPYFGPFFLRNVTAVDASFVLIATESYYSSLVAVVEYSNLSYTTSGAYSSLFSFQTSGQQLLGSNITFLHSTIFGNTNNSNFVVIRTGLASNLVLFENCTDGYVPLPQNPMPSAPEAVIPVSFPTSGRDCGIKARNLISTTSHAAIVSLTLSSASSFYVKMNLLMEGPASSNGSSLRLQGGSTLANVLTPSAHAIATTRNFTIWIYESLIYGFFINEPSELWLNGSLSKPATIENCHMAMKGATRFNIAGTSRILLNDNNMMSSPPGAAACQEE